MFRRAMFCLLALVAVWHFTSCPAMADGWDTLYEDGFLTSQISDQYVTTGNWTVDHQTLGVQTDQGAMLRLNKIIKAPAIRVSLECWITGKTTSDLTILIGLGSSGQRGATRYTLAANQNTGTRLSVPAKAPLWINAFKLKPDQHYMVVAEANGTVMTLRVDGRVIAQRNTLLPLEPGQIALFLKKGQAHFAHLRIQTRATAQKVQAIQIRKTLMTTVSQKQLGFIPTTWNVSALKTKKRSARVRKRNVSIFARSQIKTTQPYPITFGVPFPKRQLFKASQIRMLDLEGQEIPTQITPVATWDQEDALQWVRVDTQIPFQKIDEPKELILEYGRVVRRKPIQNPIRVSQDDQAIIVDAGKLKVRFSKTRGTLIDAAWVDGKQVMKPTFLRGGFFKDNRGHIFRTSGKDPQYQLTLEQQGPLHTIIRATGRYVDENGENACRYVTRIHLYAHQAILKIEHTWIVTEDTDQMWFEDLGVNLPMTLGQISTGLFGINQGNLKQFRKINLANQNALLIQDSIDQMRMIVQGKQLASQTTQTSGWGSLIGKNFGATLSVYDMALQFPNALEISPRGITFHAWHTRDGRQLDFRHASLKKLWGDKNWERLTQNATSQGALTARVTNGLGFARTHTLTLTFHPPQSTEAQQAGALSQFPPIALAAPKWNCQPGLLPYTIPPYNDQKFGTLEKQVRTRFDQFVHVATHLSPMVGFWDYGRGCPRDLKKAVATLPNSERWIFSGLDANDDMSYGNPMVPWLLYLRSGERRYLRRAKAMTTQVMDARILHWYSHDMGRQIGQSYKRTGTWVFDGTDVGWNGDIRPGFLATAFLVTGDQRPLDVLGEIVQGYAHAPRKPLTDESVTYLGAVARYYRLTWDPALLKLLQDQTPVFLQRQTPTGFWPSANTSFEYALLELLQLPHPKPNWRNVAMTFARGAIGPMRFHTSWALAAGIQAWAYAHEPDARFGINAQEVLKTGIPNLTAYSNLAPLQTRLVWMGLRDVPGTREYAKPRIITYARPQESTFYLKHEQGRETYLQLHCQQAELSITDQTGKPIAPVMLRSEREIGIYEITIPSNYPTTQYQLQFKLPVLYENKSNGALGRSLPWRPGENELLVIMQGPTLFVQDISNGKLTHDKGPAYFFVPRRTRSFSLRVADTTPQPNQITLQLPTGQKKTILSYHAEIKPTDRQTGKIWSVSSKNPYFVLEKTSFSRGNISPHYLKLIGIPPFIAPSAECLFRPIAASTQHPEKTLIHKIAYPRGRFRRGIRLQGAEAYVQIPTGATTSDAAVRQYFNARQGTLEMFIRFDRRAIEGGYHGQLLSMQFADDPAFMMTFNTRSHWTGMMRSGGGQIRKLVLTDSFCSPSIQAGRWYHLAIQWNLNDNGKTMRRVYLDGYPYAYGDASGRLDPIDWWPAATIPGEPGDWLYLGDNGKHKNVDSMCVVDELRISDIQRYPFMPGPPSVGGRRAFIPPAEPFTPDANTCALFHFEGNTIGLDRHNQPINAQRVATRPKVTAALRP